ncbi:PilN domain-containing protein [Limnobacter sp.]|uniref:PilN domain-containing protein n=1 Tax=Limnobacter sp. TaxID=2003368 RepID=UPI002FE1ABEE
MRVILFNLSPYRVLRENKRRRRVVAELCAGLLAGLLFCYSVGSEFSDRVARKEQFLGNLSAMESEVATRAQEVQAMKDRLAVLNRQVSALKAVEEESLLASQWVSFLDGTVPNSVSITRVSAAKDVMTVNGFTDAVSGLAAWVDQMEAGNELFHSVDLITLTEPATGGGEKASQRHLFEIKASLRGGNDAPR